MMSSDVPTLICTKILIIALLHLIEGHSQCISTTDTRYCKDSCSSACPESSSCPKQCIHCKPGYYGPYCVRACKGRSHCLHNNCYLLSSGRALNCSEGCRTGWRGLSCNTLCKYPCLECDRYTGDCVGPCRDGYFGVGCSERCDEHCVRCDKHSGNCTGPCYDGYFGSDCSQQCDDNCAKCDKGTGNCTGPCVAGYYGEGCFDQCQGHCKHCDRISGECVNKVIPTEYDDFIETDKIGFRGRSDFSIIIVSCALAGVFLLSILLLAYYFSRINGKSSRPSWKKEIKDYYQTLVAPGCDKLETKPMTKPFDRFIVAFPFNESDSLSPPNVACVT